LFNHTTLMRCIASRNSNEFNIKHRFFEFVYQTGSHEVVICVVGFYWRSWRLAYLAALLTVSKTPRATSEGRIVGSQWRNNGSVSGSQDSRVRLRHRTWFREGQLPCLTKHRTRDLAAMEGRRLLTDFSWTSSKAMSDGCHSSQSKSHREYPSESQSLDKPLDISE
jgi:hypothetical protein